MRPLLASLFALPLLATGSRAQLPLTPLFSFLDAQAGGVAHVQGFQIDLALPTPFPLASSNYLTVTIG
ncbi:MAG: hypothetical protein L0323_22165 [Planctomycetes bacterium]|nr:hypothetical protein [Planctomycetota bacterium]